MNPIHRKVRAVRDDSTLSPTAFDGGLMGPIAPGGRVVYDANVLFPGPLRDFLIRLAIEELVSAHWTERILDEVFQNLAKKRPELDASKLQRTRQVMCEAILDCLVSDYQEVEETLVLPDPNDRHVLAAAITISAAKIITFNLKDFPDSRLLPHEVVAVHPDTFAVALLQNAPSRVCAVLLQQAVALKNPPRSVTDVLSSLEQSGQTRFAVAARAELGIP